MASIEKQSFTSGADNALEQVLPSKLPPVRSSVETRDIEQQIRKLGRSRLQQCGCQKCGPESYNLLGHPADTPRLFNIRGLRFRSHNAWHVATLAVASFDTKNITGRQHPALWEWKCWYNESTLSPFFQRQKRRRCFQKTSGCVLTPNLWTYNLVNIDVATLDKAVKLFDTIFFLDALKGRVRIRWRDQTDNSRPIAERGVTRMPHREEEMTVITINPYSVFHCLNPRNLMCTILHEMAHAFLNRYSCHACCNSHLRSTCKRLYIQNLGATGHGRAWQFLAKSIEDAMPRLLGFAGRLGRDECFLQELRAEGGYAPSVCDREKLFSGAMEGMVAFNTRWRLVDDLEAARLGRQARKMAKREGARCRRKTFACGQRPNPFFWS